MFEIAAVQKWQWVGVLGFQTCSPNDIHKYMYIVPLVQLSEKVNFKSQILERPSIVEYWNISGVPVLPENVIFTFYRTCWCYSEAYNTGTQKWSSIVQYSCTSIWDLKYTFSVVTTNDISANWNTSWKWDTNLHVPSIFNPEVKKSSLENGDHWLLWILYWYLGSLPSDILTLEKCINNSLMCPIWAGMEWLRFMVYPWCETINQRS